MAIGNEATARIKINRLLENAGWRFFDNEHGKANIRLEANAKITKADIDAWGNDFENTTNGSIDFLLLDDNDKPLVVLEAKKESADLLAAKEQARDYATSPNIQARFVLLSNGNLHYFWDLQGGNPELITQFPTQESLTRRAAPQTEKRALASEVVDANYIANSQKPNFLEDPSYAENPEQYINTHKLRILRPYQLASIHALQTAASKHSKTRFLFEMATGTGKTLISAAIIKLFLRSGNARRVLFLVDRLELETQAHNNFTQYLSNDYESVIYKHNRDDWQRAEIVVTTVQSLAARDKYQRFSPTDFDLIIADESHRAISGNSRAVFEYFIGYKLGLTATPKDYLKNVDVQKLSEKDPRALEKRQLLDTYTTFGCEGGEPTFRYSLADGVQGGYLINPVLVDARTDITTELLSQKGYAVIVQDEDGSDEEMFFEKADFERKFFSENTNHTFCKAFLENALCDPISGEIGKSIIFCVTQKHAAKIAATLNAMAMQTWAGKYDSDFAVQVTSNVDNAQSFARQFANNNLNGTTQFLEGYKTSKTRVCVTVGMMTTGYDCQDILNLALLRPIFSPTDFVQMKGRGTRQHTFVHTNEHNQKQTKDKTRFRLFDFFANYQYFEKEHNYDEVLKLPLAESSEGSGSGGIATPSSVEVFNPDNIAHIDEQVVTEMRVDREFFNSAQTQLREDQDIQAAVKNQQWQKAVQILKTKHEDKPELYLTLGKLERAMQLDRRLTWREVLELVFGLIPTFRSKDELLESECAKFISIHKPEDNQRIPLIKNYLKSYATDGGFRKIIDSGNYTDLTNHAGFSMAELLALGGEWQQKITDYVKMYVSTHAFNSTHSPDKDKG